jgi:hypothetical protein
MTLTFTAVIKRADLTKRNHGQIMKVLNRELMVTHSFETLPKHFNSVPETHPGSGAYKYRSRGTKYNEQKLRKYGHSKPNVYSGSLRASVFSKIKITATQHGSKLTTRGTPKSRLQDWQKREITIITQKEAAAYRKVKAKRYAQRAKSPQYRRVRRRRSRK